MAANDSLKDTSIEDSGQDQRQKSNQQSQRESGTDWAEYDANAAPQITVEQAPEVVPGQSLKGLDGAVDVEADIRPPSASENKPPVPEHLPWKTRILNSRLCSWKLLLPLVVVLLVAIIVPVVVLQRRDNSRLIDDGIPSGETSFTTTHVSRTDTSSSPLASRTSISSPIAECRPSDFRTDVNWIGIAGEVGWKFKLSDADDAEDCCKQCYQSTREGCNGWLFMPGNGDDSSVVPPCNIIYGYRGPDEDDECPGGKPDIVFAGASDSEENFGGGGPCAGAVRGRR
ncbi:hypothetical protein VD0004_g6606 [Verticillium dahliae]|uniref:Uncharacterized protein n=1 Tax=Verticillium dahliae TaxID=27337 RepID=A0A444S001_VERDA|nr:hypothetical protein VdG2_08524 [Verticillium dahliae VDG2]KAH6705922.1 hypothetical protein EV126DRAFT_413224 [Verticillium dahliae]PNH33082.1 hypothetical protein BJF96_g3647 [Verticillium dahliae]PNH40397.1 hypothetical protein VD0004_g6606 [Verticillium dahliae]PNH70911.1 hypothetical protein VD0001_g6625 [Verticillium dahliae]